MAGTGVHFCNAAIEIWHALYPLASQENLTSCQLGSKIFTVR